MRREDDVGKGAVSGDGRSILRQVALSLAISIALVALLYRFVVHADAASGSTGLIETLRGVELPLVGVYLFAHVGMVYFRAARYRLLLRGCGEPRVPGLLPLALVTAVRNMFVDLLPARIGEFSYVALLNRRYNVRVLSGVSSLGVAVFLDFVALLAVLALLVAAPLAGSVAFGGLPGTAALLSAVVVFLAWALFTGVRLAARLGNRLPQPLRERRPVRQACAFLEGVADQIAAIRGSGVLLRSIVLSLGLRLSKYAGLYALYLAVTRSNFGQFARAPVREVVAALIAGEGTASLPVPSFMSFGTYEAGGLATFAAFGFPAAQAVLVLLCLHLVSQVIDYSLGALALIGIALIGSGERPAVRPEIVRRRLALLAVLFALAAVALGVRSWRQRDLAKQGVPASPAPGVATAPDPDLSARIDALLGKRRGFIVWSSNRYGTHDLLRMELPGGAITRLTTNPHAETYPRISPDGRQVVFSRSQVPWVSQRDLVSWDVWVVDLASGAERFVARDAIGPFWSRDGGTVYFQRNGGEFVAHTLATGDERVLFRAGVPPVPAGAILGNPDYDESTGRLVATLRGSGVPRITALFTASGSLQELGGGGDCQASFSPDRHSVYFVGQGGRQQNALYRLVPGSRAELWLDLPGDLSHEYFPRQSADGRLLIFAASAGGLEHEHDAGDYELFLWRVGDPGEKAVRLTHHTGNDSWPDLHLFSE